MTVNPVGYVPVADGGVPRIMTAYAFEVISGGQFCFASGAANAVSSGLNSFASTDIGVAASASGIAFNGIAVQDAASGGEVGIATRGLVIVRAGGTITNGQGVMAVDGHCVTQVASTSGANVPAMVNTAIQFKIGRAWTSATSGNYVLIELNP